MKHIFLTFLVLSFGSLWAQDRLILPHIPSDLANFEVRVVVENQLETNRSLLLESFTNSGSLLGTTILEMEPMERININPQELHNGEIFSYAMVSGRYISDKSTQDTMTGVVAGISYAYKNRPETWTFAEAVKSGSRHWRMNPGDWSDSFDGVAIVNVETCVGSGAELRHYSPDGKLLDTVTVGPNRGRFAKTVVNLAAVLQPFAGSYIDIVADTDLAVTGLRGSLDRGAEDAWLVGNVALMLPDNQKQRRLLEENRDKWSRASLDSAYLLDVRNVCFCPDDMVRGVTLRVEHDWIASFNYSSDGAEVPSELRQNFWTVRSLFSLIERSLDENLFDVRVIYDEAWGYPTEIFLDREACLADEEIIIRVDNLTPIK